jgi:DMSO reductase anchor subunit
VLLAVWRVGDGAFARAGQTLGTATGLDRLGVPSVFDPAHTAGNYLKREMIFVVGRKHAARLRKIALVLASVLPAVICCCCRLGVWGIALAAALHLAGAMAARWLFFRGSRACRGALLRRAGMIPWQA